MSFTQKGAAILTSVDLVMSVELSQLMQLIVGQRKFLTVGNLPARVRMHFACNPGVVYLRHDEALHFFNGHDDVGLEDALQISLVVEKGTYYLDNKRPKCSTIIYHNKENNKPYMMGIKIVNSGEVWIATFHHTNDKKIHQRFKSRPIIS